MANGNPDASQIIANAAPFRNLLGAVSSGQRIVISPDEHQVNHLNIMTARNVVAQLEHANHLGLQEYERLELERKVREGEEAKRALERMQR